MNKMGKIFLILATVTVFMIFSMTGRADVGEPGSESDPLVTKSYVDKLFSNIQQSINSGTGGSVSPEIVNLSPGQQLVGDMGTEIILRSGQAVIVDGAGGGLADVTAGKDIKKDEIVPANHLLIVPRDDGRGITAKSNVVVMVRGNFTVKR
ncbi:hypothetical protein [Thermosediminibacter oceani]|uniref:Uncharacterized protein n=1 Tax=Thermosediminibacter oceani (strain ATCC BAA-1034 / DSM 16646 / JW/IW-1228P) TaxID=555079 RepID=D9RYL9_THEOJ|nr:hypothetical protein [Thermosediminibacter oceani]ADL08443.1 conserved hypothetical protein [Thermosediminibacter oceani DSM 16646]